VTVVGPVSARVVRQDSAERAVTAMSDLLDENGADPIAIAVDPDAYDESAPALYVYRQRDEDGSHTGVVCDVRVRAFLEGRVRGHEAVQPARVAALVRHHATAPGPPALVALLHRAGRAFTDAVEATVRTEPILDFDGPRATRQTVWRMADGPAARAVLEELSGAVLYIADGHHRVAAALEEWRLGGEPADAGVLCVVHPMGDLRLSAFSRRVPGPIDQTELIGLLTPVFEIRPVSAPSAPTPGSYGLYVGRHWFELTRREGRPDGSAALDVAALEAALRDRLPLLTVSSSHSIEIPAAQTSFEELIQRCDADGGALFSLAPPSLDVITALADAGKVMPPKTTYFAPKPAAGIFLRPGE
jgi:uncharacterized protein (DUF1015 family)